MQNAMFNPCCFNSLTGNTQPLRNKKGYTKVKVYPNILTKKQ